MQEKYALIYKNLGETPLEALERFRRGRFENFFEVRPQSQEEVGPRKSRTGSQIPLTYAGRLDPMAEGELLILIGEECKNKDKYLGLDKEYEVEILFGVTTDTYDVLGIGGTSKIIDNQSSNNNQIPIINLHPSTSLEASTNSRIIASQIDLQKYVCTFEQKYPAYSSKTVGGIQLHTLARAGELPSEDEMPTKEVEIYSIEDMGVKSVACDVLKDMIIDRIRLVKGDFRQAEIIKSWNVFFKDKVNEVFWVLKIRVFCSAGTYMRALADKIGHDMGTLAIALSIKRTKIVLE